MFRNRPLLFMLIGSLLLAAFVVRLLAAPPGWWSAPGTQIVDPAAEQDNYAPANLGQLKHTATQAKKHLDQQLAAVGGAGATINALIAGFEPRAGQGYTPEQIAAFKEANYAPVNLGQLKAVAKPFYDRLHALGVDTKVGLIAHGYPATWTHTYPWNPADPWNLPTPQGQQVDKTVNYAPANLGQLKLTFSFDANQDTDEDGIPDWWEHLYASAGLDPHNPSDASQTAPGGLTFLQSYEMGIDPNDPLQGAPPAAPTGLRLLFPDASVHPEDPDISQIRVEWNPPVETGVTISFEKTYAGNPGGSWTPVSLSSTTATQSPLIADLPSKRIHQYRVTFTAPNGQSSCSDIAYEVPVIRGFMHRKIATDLKFPGVLLYPDLPFDGVPRKFRKLTHTWNFDSTSVTQYLSAPPVTEIKHQDGSYARQMYPYTRSHSISGEAHESKTTTHSDGSGNYQWNWDRTYDFDLTEPGGSDPNGLVTVDSTDATTENSVVSSSKEEHLQLGLGLQPFQVANAADTAVSPLPFSSFSATDEGHYSAHQSNGNSGDFSWSASPSLVADSDGQHLDWSGSYEDSTTVSGTTSTTPGPRNYGSIGYSLGSASVAVGDFDPGRTGVVTATTGSWAFPTHGDNPPPGVTPEVSVSPDGLSWTRSYTYSSSENTETGSNTYEETWSETVTVADEITADDLADAAVATYAPLGTIGWFIPGQPQSRFSSGFSVNALGLFEGSSQFTYPWLDWDYTHSYSGITSDQLAAASAPGQSYVKVEPQFGALVGQYTLNADETSGNLLSSEYKFRFYPPAESTTIAWLETFTPDPTEADQAPQSQLHTCDVSSGQTTDSDIQVADRTEAWYAQAPQAAPPATKRKGQAAIGALPPPEILQPKLGADGNVVKDGAGQDVLEVVTSVRFSRWSDAFTVPDSVPVPAFETTDKDRFYVRFTSPQAAGLKVGTYGLSGLLGSETEDPPVSMSSSRPDASTNVWKSSPMILVTDHEDDATYNGFGIAGDNQYNDATHLGSFGGNVLAFLLGKGVGINIPVMKPQGKVRVNFYVLGESQWIRPDEAQAILKDFYIAKQIYAQIGVVLEKGNIIGRAAGNAINGLLADKVLTYDPLNFSQAGTEAGTYLENTPSTTGVNEIPVYYIRATIRSIHFATDNKSRRGFAMRNGDSVGAITILLDDAQRTTLAHEIGHSLGLDHVGGNDENAPPIQHRLMSNGTSYNGKFHDSKRFSKSEEDTIKTPRKFYVPIP
jgi:hypothetical protein